MKIIHLVNKFINDDKSLISSEDMTKTDQAMHKTSLQKLIMAQQSVMIVKLIVHLK